MFQVPSKFKETEHINIIPSIYKVRYMVRTKITKFAKGRSQNQTRNSKNIISHAAKFVAQFL